MAKTVCRGKCMAPNAFFDLKKKKKNRKENQKINKLKIQSRKLESKIK